MSFTNDDILVLARAGFTSQQISALNSVQTQPTQPAQPTQPTQPEEPVTLDVILNAIRQNAINSTQQPATQTTDDILAEIINPTVKE